ncbi:Sec7-domain-containing protein [Basidiobolus meristosporus CBS 931.73]|uniref:Sec7-domain-containing protein n=1 Tax=Basidiobolus meristosporus CBS 931.73 TaxID=1314790 RepID=A0A1Y1YCU6_9FUNG|nr:Sec7-domain-containing protein [Basidiobolus meristosporus CBS 931.73]|eukprot:ORX95819.1 Sec7-domain-containing protein [Basidiobolus meristosporus CBS 931.73]
MSDTTTTIEPPSPTVSTPTNNVINNHPDASICTASDSEILVLPLKLACLTGSNNLTVIAVDCIGKLITYNYIINGQAASSTLPTSPNTSTLETIPETTTEHDKTALEDSAAGIPPTGQDNLTDQLIDLALLAAITSNTFKIHQRALLKAVRTTYNIFLLSRDPGNQTIAQGILTQMVHAIFSRIQLRKSSMTVDVDAKSTPDTAELTHSAPVQNISNVNQESDSENLSVSTSEPAKGENDAETKDKQPGVFDERSEDVTEQRRNSIANSNSEKELTKEETASVENPLDPTLDVPESDHISSISDEFTDLDDKELVNIPLDSNTEKLEVLIDERIDTLKETLTAVDSKAISTSLESQADMFKADIPEESPLNEDDNNAESISSAFKDSDTPQSSSKGQTELSKGYDDAGYVSSAIDDIEVRDAYLLFRALCRLSMKPISTEGASDVRSLSMRSKLLSLHLILIIITSHLETFTSSNVGFVTYTEQNQPVYVSLLTSVKQYLCLSLSRNLTSTVGGIFEVSLEIFLKLLQGLRMLLKKEIEVFFKEIFLPILEMRSATFHQKTALLNILQKICNDPQTLVEIYLNYDCDKEALDNIYERLVNVISKITTVRTGPSSTGVPSSNQHSNSIAPSSGVIQPSLTTTSVNNSLSSQLYNQGNESDIKQKALECLVAVLRSLTTWSDKGLGVTEGENTVLEDDKQSRLTRKSEDAYENANSIVEANGHSSPSPVLNGSTPSIRSLALDDPGQFETLKQRKQVLQQGIQMFNWKPKKGFNFLLETHCIENRDPKTIARFFLNTEGINKTTLGEFLGEGSEENVAIMHAFVDDMSFSDMPFVDALRRFLQPFRLPGEAQKIDRFMLKFAERYVIGNSGKFANADTAYVLAYSVILLNTDLHNPQVKHRMSLIDFLKNNAGIDDKADLPDEFLAEIYDDISKNEIRIKDEKGVASNSFSNGPMNIFKDLSPFEVITGKARRELYAHASAELASKTEAIFKGRGSRGISRVQATYYSASHFEHVRPMFELVWMAFLAGVSSPMQEYDDLEIVNLCLEGLKFAVHIASIFDMELERNAFVSTLAKSTYLNNLSEMKVKNVEAIKTLLEIALSEGNNLKESWRDVLACVSQLERFQLISNGADSDTIPDISNARRVPNSQPQLEKRQSSASLHSNKSHRTSTIHTLYAEEAAIETRSQQVVVAVDRIFTGSVRLSGPAVVDFVRALSEISMEEIRSSTNAEHPRTYCLQKLVEICYYNMSRIRMEWSNMWAILGDHFNQVGCHSNNDVAFFALDSLRQLSMKFLEKEELPHFKFQKDFLRPFEFIIEHNENYNIKDMVLRCLQQMIQARGYHIRSGWKTMFGVFSKAAQDENELIVAMAFEIIKSVAKNNFDDIATHGCLQDFVSCLVQFCQNTRFVKTSLHSMEIFKQITQKLIAQQTANDRPDSPVAGRDDGNSFWFPIMLGLYDIVMNCEDLEVRNRALNYMFDSLKQHGTEFRCDFWKSIFHQVIFPIFNDFDSSCEKSRFKNPEDMSVWLSTTLIQAIRNTIDLFTFYFETLKGMTDGVLELLYVCITQENETLARIGNSCLQQLIESNISRLDSQLWDKICSTFVRLFDSSSPQGLFDFRKALSEPEPLPSSPYSTDLPPRTSSLKSTSYSQMEKQKQEFRRITLKCVLRLLLIQTVDELFNSNDQVYQAIDSHHLFIIIDSLERSYWFAQRFNSDLQLRSAIYEAGTTSSFMDPNNISFFFIY